MGGGGGGGGGGGDLLINIHVSVGGGMGRSPKRQCFFIISCAQLYNVMIVPCHLFARRAAAALRISATLLRIVTDDICSLRV